MRHNIDSREGFVHTPVMWREVLDFFKRAAVTGDKIFIDGTLGEGGHSELILSTFSDVRVLGFDRDPVIIEIARKRLEAFGSRIEFFNDNFVNISGYTDNYKGRISGILYDFGISSFHFDKSGRGFSLSKDEPLDMRLDSHGEKSAAYIINNYNENDLSSIFRDFGEERWSKRIARAVVEARRKKRICTTLELAEVVRRAIPSGKRVRNIHPATRVFQALRIAVNDELRAINEAFGSSYNYLAPGGVLMAISFHSLEDRIVKNSFRRLARGCTCDSEAAQCRCENEPFVKILTKKPLIPADDEISLNRRSRSAKMRVCERL